MDTTQAVVTDPWDSAETPQVRQAEFFGQVQLDTYYAVLEKGVGKVPFDPAKHSIDKRVTAIEIKILPLAEQNMNYSVSRVMIAESKEWAGIVLPSIKALGVSVRELNGKFVRAHYKPTGSTYVNANGETKDRTTVEFLQVFASEAECRAAFLGEAAGTAPVAPKANGGIESGSERETALKFLRVVVENAARGQSDLNVIRSTVAANIANMPLINKYFTADSPEALELMMAGMSHA